MLKNKQNNRPRSIWREITDL